MSSSDLYVLNKRSTTWLAGFRNGWGSGPVAWDWIGERYIAEKPIYSGDRRYLEKVWALHSDKRLSADERIVLLMTFDRAYVPLDKCKEAGDSCVTFWERSHNGERVNNWGDIGQFLLSVAGKKFNRFARGVCLSCTSVSDVWCEASQDQINGAWSIFDEPSHD